MSPFIIVAIVILAILLIGLAILALKKKFDDDAEAASGNNHDHSAGADNCPACQASGKPVKVNIPLKCMVQFRPKTTWNGEFGFDWMRIGDVQEKAYFNVIEGGYKGTVAGTVQEFTKDEAYLALKKEYQSIPTEIKSVPEDLKEYFVPYLNLYPKNTAGIPSPPFEAELRILVTVIDIEPEKIDIEYNKKVFTLDRETLTDKAIGDGKKRVSSETLKITCDNKFDKQEEIKVWAYPKGAKSQQDATLVGKMLVSANDEANRKELKFVFVRIKTKIENVERKGNFNVTEKQNLSNALYQALIHGTFEDGPDLDLRKDPNFRITTDASGKKTVGKFIKKTADGILKDDPTAVFNGYLKTKFLALNRKYANYFPVFSFDEQGYDGAQGQIEKIGTKNLVVFQIRDNATLNHEVLHGLGLRHTEKGVAGPDRKYIFTAGSTDNIMENLPAPVSTWHWQWEIMKRHI